MNKPTLTLQEKYRRRLKEKIIRHYSSFTVSAIYDESPEFWLICNRCMRNFGPYKGKGECKKALEEVICCRG